MGRVKSLNYKGNESEKILKNSKTSNGYLSVSLSKDKNRKTVKVHRLVAETFIPNLENKSQVNHIDGNKENNNIKNFEWVTDKENKNHAYKLGLIDKNILMKCNKNKERRCTKEVLQINKENKKIINRWNSIKEASIQTNICRVSISNCINGKLKTAGGYIWESIKNK